MKLETAERAHSLIETINLHITNIIFWEKRIEENIFKKESEEGIKHSKERIVSLEQQLEAI